MEPKKNERTEVMAAIWFFCGCFILPRTVWIRLKNRDQSLRPASDNTLSYANQNKGWVKPSVGVGFWLNLCEDPSRGRWGCKFLFRWKYLSRTDRLLCGAEVVFGVNWQMKKENASRLAEIALHTKEEYGLKKPALGQKNRHSHHLRHIVITLITVRLVCYSGVHCGLS